MTHFFKRHIRRALFGVLGVTLIAGGLSACGHHRVQYEPFDPLDPLGWGQHAQGGHVL